jgi:hypothetical protein
MASSLLYTRVLQADDFVSVFIDFPIQGFPPFHHIINGSDATFNP